MPFKRSSNQSCESRQLDEQELEVIERHRNEQVERTNAA
jgi:hypothetical protein